MRSLRTIIKGMIVGLMLSTVNLGITYAGKSLIAGRPGLPLALIIAGLAMGLVAGAAAVVMGHLSAGRERMILVLLVNMAVASLAVYLGGYGNGSLVPPAIYGLALINGLLISAASSPLCAGLRSPQHSM